ncbi:MAG: hypothetical protein HY831_03700 [Candidatus Aenigmarchaeota archaeon]|nr:hypothetical protein [Candidatus Aenigmarchaeota archaeon]
MLIDGQTAEYRLSEITRIFSESSTHEIYSNATINFSSKGTSFQVVVEYDKPCSLDNSTGDVPYIVGTSTAVSLMYAGPETWIVTDLFSKEGIAFLSTFDEGKEYFKKSLQNLPEYISQQQVESQI